MQKTGALPSQTLTELIDAEFIRGASKENVSPASLDLSVSDEIYEIAGLVLPKGGATIRSLFEVMDARPTSIDTPLRAGGLYLARLNETLELPKQVYGYCNPKSSTGRLDVHVRVLADGVPRYDSVTPEGYSGELWVAIYPKSFCIQLHPKTPLTQLRLFTEDTRFSELDLEIAMQRGLVWHPKKDAPLSYGDLITSDRDGAVVLSAMVEEGVSGYHCIADSEAVVDIERVGEYDAKDFFEPLTLQNGMLYLKHDHFYILSSAERVRIPPTLASEMMPVDERSGDFRSHYAGFLDPGWGFGTAGEGKGRPFTLEVRPFENLIVRSGQPVAKIQFEKMAEEPEIHYDTKQSNYLSQSGPKLGKQFK